MNSANGPDMPAPNTLDEIKKIIQEATPQLVLKGLRNGVIPLFAMVNYNSTAKGRELLLEFLEWQEKVKAYIKEEYPPSKPEPSEKEVKIGPIDIEPWTGPGLGSKIWTDTSNDKYEVTYLVIYNIKGEPEPAVEVVPDA